MAGRRAAKPPAARRDVTLSVPEETSPNSTKSRRKRTADEKPEIPDLKSHTRKRTSRKSAKDAAVLSQPSTAVSKKPTTAKVAGAARKHTSRARATPQPFKNTPPSTRLDIFVFGEGSSGELGLGPSSSGTEVATPRLNGFLDASSVGVVALDCGGMHTVALTHGGQVLTWGINDQSTLARDTTWDGGMRDLDAGSDSDASSEPDLNPLESTPAAISTDTLLPGTRIVQVGAGDSTTFLLTEDGLVYGCGTFRNSNGIYGFTLDKHQAIVKIQQRPLLIQGLDRIIQISVGNDFVLALKVDGTVYAWGTGQQGQLGRKLLDRRQHTALLPTLVGFPKRIKIVSIHAASNHAFAIDANGDTWAWGLNNFAQTGILQGVGEGGNAVLGPQKVPLLEGKQMKKLSGGSHHSIGVTASGKCLVWGRLDGGQLGLDISTLPLEDSSSVMLGETGKPRILLKPQALPISDCVWAAAGPEHNIVLTEKGKAYSWGFNATYQCGQGDSDDIEVAKLMNGKAIRDRKIVWAGCGGQFSMLASAYQEDSR